MSFAVTVSVHFDFRHWSRQIKMVLSIFHVFKFVWNSNWLPKWNFGNDIFDRLTQLTNGWEMRRIKCSKCIRTCLFIFSTSTEIFEILLHLNLLHCMKHRASNTAKKSTSFFNILLCNQCLQRWKSKGII